MKKKELENIKKELESIKLESIKKELKNIKKELKKEHIYVHKINIENEIKSFENELKEEKNKNNTYRLPLKENKLSIIINNLENYKKKSHEFYEINKSKSKLMKKKGIN
eukprot:EC821598.1.p1 GENE.EC821598.1~~EC821598.1.p1  ORF type:complete len:109 (+),score=50.06 EC821598.1:3-329(+)